MKKLTLLLFALILSAQEKPLAEKLKEAEQSARISELKALILQEQLYMKQIAEQKQSLYNAICKAEGLEADPNICEVNMDTKKVSKKDKKDKK